MEGKSGRKNGLREVANNLLKMGYDEKEIEKATGLSIEEIERIKQKLDKK